MNTTNIERLKWNPDDYSNITLLRVSSDKIWTY